jgi:histidine triad (HIT) family protein
MTIFEKFLNKEIPVDAVYEDDDVLAIRDIQPQAPCHILVVPKKYAQNISQVIDWSDEDVGRYFKKATIVAKKLGLHETGYRLVINTGHDAGQTVPYLHIHILGGQVLTHL